MLAGNRRAEHGRSRVGTGTLDAPQQALVRHGSSYLCPMNSPFRRSGPETVVSVIRWDLVETGGLIASFREYGEIELPGLTPGKTIVQSGSVPDSGDSGDPTWSHLRTKSP